MTDFKQHATLYVILISAESIFIGFLKGKNNILLKRQEYVFTLSYSCKQPVKQILILKIVKVVSMLPYCP